MPAANAATEVFYDHNEYVGGTLFADPATRDLATIIELENEKLGKAAGVRTEAKRKANRATAVRDYSFRQVTISVDAFHRKSVAEFPLGAADKGHKAIFPKPLSQFVRVAIEDREAVLGALVKRMTGDKLPKELAAPGKAAATAWKAYQTAATALEAAEVVLKQAREALDEAKQANITTLTRLEGKLKDRFAEDPARARSYFPPAKAKASDDELAAKAAEKAAKAAAASEKSRLKAEALEAKAKKQAEAAAAKAKKPREG